MLNGLILAKSFFPVRGSPQGELSKQETLVPTPPMQSPNREGSRSQSLGWAMQQCGVRKALEPPAQFCRVLQG